MLKWKLFSHELTSGDCGENNNSLVIYFVKQGFGQVYACVVRSTGKWMDGQKLLCRHVWMQTCMDGHRCVYLCNQNSLLWMG